MLRLGRGKGGDALPIATKKEEARAGKDVATSGKRDIAVVGREGTQKTESQGSYRKRIDAADTQQEKDTIRYQRHCDQSAEKGKEPLERSQWDVSKNRAWANQERGTKQEKAVCNDLGVQNNNGSKSDDGKRRTPIEYKCSEPKTTTRPDFVTPKAWGDVKSVKSKDGVLHDADQLRAQRFGARHGSADGVRRDHVVVMTSSDADRVRPSRPLANNSTVLHRHEETGQWSRWDTDANRRQGGWADISTNRAREMTGANASLPRDQS